MLRKSLSYDCSRQFSLLLFVLPFFFLSVQNTIAANSNISGMPVGDTSIFQLTDVPAIPIVNDGMAMELGVKFKSLQNGSISGIRFYKAAAGTNTYSVHLWSNTGTRLAEATFTSDSATGWKQVSFAAPVAIKANTTYVASYFSSAGDYANTNPFFTKAVVNGPLKALANGEDGPNGLYKYSETPAFPEDNFGTSNYWVDVVFKPDANAPVVSAVTQNNVATRSKDTIAPAISGMRAVPNADGTTNITWTTNENADATVHYGVSADNLNLHTGDNKAATAHSVRLNGLIPGLTYYFRIASKDMAGNAVTKPTVTAPPLTFTVPQGPCAVDSATANFNQGNLDIGAAVSPDGTVTLQPQVNEEFISVLKTIPEGWSGARYNSDGTTVNNNGVITVNGTHIFSATSFEPGSSIEFAATFGAGSYQNIGFSIDQPYADGAWITIGQGNLADGNIYARASNNTEIKLGSNLLRALHHYRIKWNPTNFEFYVDGGANPLATINMKVTANMFIQISDYASTDEGLSIDWLHVTPYATSGIFTSRVFDAGDATDWGAVTWHSNVPAGTSLSISISTGNTPDPNDGTWSAFKAITQGGNAGSSSRYIQYKAALATTNTKATPVLKDIAINCAGNRNMAEKIKQSVRPASASTSNVDLNVKVMPNPSSDYFSLAITGNNDKPVIVNVLDTYGRILENHPKATPNTTLEIGQALSPGNYFVEVIQGTQRKTVKIVKVK